MAAREACVIALDVSPSMSDAIGVVKVLCSTLVQQKLVFSPRDLVGMVIGGTTQTLNRLNAASGEYTNVVVARPVTNPSADFLKIIDNVAPSSASVPFDILDTIVVAEDLIQEAVGEKKFSRRIFLVTCAAGAVKKKERLAAIVEGMKRRGVALVVIGVDFDELDGNAAATANFASLTAKKQNEVVLHLMCTELGGDSIVVAVHDALSAVSALRKRHIAQRAYCKCILDIGDIRIPVTLFTKCLESRIPSFGKVTTKGESVAVERRYFSLRDPDKEIDASQRIRAYRYGRSAIPVNEVDHSRLLKIKTDRGMSALGFVHVDQIPLHVLQGGCKMVTPVAGDALGARAFSAVVQAMSELKRSMLVRFTRCTNASPVIGACFASSKAEKDVLYYVALPFAEDVRGYVFSGLQDVHGTPEQHTAVQQLVDAMDLDRFETGVIKGVTQTDPSVASPSVVPPSGAVPIKEVPTTVGERLLAIKDTFNPALQHYYHALKERYLRPDAPLPPMPPQVARTATAWGQPGNVLSPLLQQQASVLCRKRVRELMPPMADDDSLKGKQFWYQKVGGSPLPNAVKGHLSEQQHLSVADGTSDFLASLTQAQLKDALRVSTGNITSDQMHVTTIDPVGTFHALIGRSGEDNVSRAMHELQEVILQLLKMSIGGQYYQRCSDSVRALRAASVKEGEPRSFNTFLVHLMLQCKGEGHNDFWSEHVLGTGLMPITTSECPESDVTDEQVHGFFDARIPAKRPILDDGPAEEPSIFDELE